MTTVGIFEAKNRLSELVERAARGEEIVITLSLIHISLNSGAVATWLPDSLGLGLQCRRNRLQHG